MHKLLLVGLVLLLSITPIVKAQEEPLEVVDEIEISDEDLDVVLTHGEQDPGSKEFDLIATISSKLDSDRVIVEWELPSQIIFAEENQRNTQTTSVREDEISVATARVMGVRAGTYEVKVNVTTVKADVNYITADTLEITFNNDKEVLPLTDEYKKAKLTDQVITALVVLVVLLLVGGAGFWLYSRYRMAKQQ